MAENEIGQERQPIAGPLQGGQELELHPALTPTLGSPDSKDAFRLKREEILFAAFGGWDAAGAKLFGFPTYWLNRQKLSMERMSAILDGSRETVSELAQFLA